MQNFHISPDLKALLNTNLAAQTLFLHLATRKNNATKTNSSACENLMRDQNVSRAEVTQCWRNLEKVLSDNGYGTFVEGRHGRQSRFVWLVPTRDFCGQAINEL